MNSFLLNIYSAFFITFFLLHKNKYFRASPESSGGNSSNSSLKFNDKRATGDFEENDENFDVITQTKTDVHVHVDNFPPEDEPDFGKNPFGGRLSTNQSLFFEDGKRSVDYVLVWKSLIVDENETDHHAASKAKELKRQRAEKREVFQENLLVEGLELETYVIDDEIHFIKLHAPLEVLRRYAEILKLRLPMKEVSKLMKYYFFYLKCMTIKKNRLIDLTHVNRYKIL